MSRELTQVVVPQRDSRQNALPKDATVYNYTLRKVDAENASEYREAPCKVAFDETTLYIIEQGEWKPITMRLDLHLLKSIVDCDTFAALYGVLESKLAGLDADLTEGVLTSEEHSTKVLEAKVEFARLVSDLWQPHESIAIIADYFETGLKPNSAESNGRTAGWMEPQRKAYRYQREPLGIGFRVDAPKGKNRLLYSIAMPDSTATKLLLAIARSTASTTTASTAPNVQPAAMTEQDLVDLAASI